MKKLLFLSLIALGCSRPAHELPADALASIGGEVLTAAEVAQAVPAGLAAEDSLAFAQAWVNTWVNDRLLQHEAARHLRNLEEIEARVADYRRNLIAWEYRRLAIANSSELMPSDSCAHAYYNDNAWRMRLSEPMVRGIYVKMETSDPALKTVRRLYKSERQEDIDRLEKVGLRGAIHYDYFRDQWIPWERIISKIPHPLSAESLRKGYCLDVDIDGFTYLLSVSDVLPAGATMPYEAALPQIRETLQAQNAAGLDAQLLQYLREQALKSGRLWLGN